VDVVERVLTRGAVVEGVRDDTDSGSETDDTTSLRVSIAGVSLLNVHSDLSWRPLDEPDERGTASE
jgi:hypothetical protein